MAIEQKTFIRGGKTLHEFIGINDTDDIGQSVHYIKEEDPDPETGQPVLWRPIETQIKRKGLGAVESILTVFERVLVGMNGELIKATGQLYRWYANEQDIRFFIAGFGLSIMMSEGNILVRAGKGFNNLPVWNTATQTLKPITSEQENEPPTNDYYGTGTAGA